MTTSAPLHHLHDAAHTHVLLLLHRRPAHCTSGPIRADECLAASGHVGAADRPMPKPTAYTE